MPTQNPSGSILAPDDIHVGFYVALHSSSAPHQSCDQSQRRPAGLSDLSDPPLGAGMPLLVRAISLPFVACAILQPGGGHAGPVIIDVRHLRLIKVSSGFVRAIAEFKMAGSDEAEPPVSGGPMTGAEPVDRTT
jgi:hypothetical protein